MYDEEYDGFAKLALLSELPWYYDILVNIKDEPYNIDYPVERQVILLYMRKIYYQ